MLLQRKAGLRFFLRPFELGWTSKFAPLSPDHIYVYIRIRRELWEANVKVKGKIFYILK